MILKIKNLFLKNFFNLSSNQFINFFFTLLITPLLFRRIGAEAFGLVTLCYSIILTEIINFMACKTLLKLKNNVKT